MASTLKTIESLPPGLYKLQIERQKGKGREATFEVSFARKTIDDMLKETSERDVEKAFAGVARLSESLADMYDSTIGPTLKTLNSSQTGEMTRGMHPLRLNNGAFASTNVHVLAHNGSDCGKAEPSTQPCQDPLPLLGGADGRPYRIWLGCFKGLP